MVFFSFPLGARLSLISRYTPALPALLAVSPMPKRKKTAAEVFDEAEENGWEPIGDADVNGDPVSKPIEPGTELNYDRMAVLWDE